MTSPIVTLEDVRAEAVALLEGVPDGDDLSPRLAALIRVAIHAAVPTLSGDGIDQTIREALAEGATAGQIHEALVLVSALGVHTLMEGSRRLAFALRSSGDTQIDAPLDDVRTTAKSRYENDSGYWRRFNHAVPGFLDALLRLSPEAYEAFFAYCGVPWRTGEIPPLGKELLSVATDAMPSHRYLPGLRVHITSAIRLGAGRTTVLRALDIAATAPSHPGIA